MKTSRDVIGLPVIELTEGKSLGRVHGLLVNPATRRVEALEVGERSLLKAVTDIVPMSMLRSIGSDAVTLQALEPDQQLAGQTERQTDLAALAERKLVGIRSVAVNGSLVGIVEDFSFDPATGDLIEIYLHAEKNKTHLALPVTTVESFGRDFVIVGENYLEQARILETPATDRSGRPIVRSLEVRAIEFVLGREAGQDVMDDDGGFIIRKGEKVTSETIDLARSKNRLTHLLIAAGVGELLDGLDFTREKLDAGSKRLLESWHNLRGRSQGWLSRKLEDDRPSPTGELRELWARLQSTLSQGGRELEGHTMEKIRDYVVGKTLANPVYDKDGTLLGGRGDFVTEEMRQRAEQAGRLQQLFLSAAAGDVQDALDPIKKQIKDVLGE